MGSRYQGLSAAFTDRLDAAVASLKAEQYKPPDMTWFDAPSADLEAVRHGRPFSKRPPNAFDEARDADRRRIAEAEPDPDDTRGQLLRRMLDLKRHVEADPNTAELGKQLAQARRDTVRAIDAEQREAARKQRQREKRQRRKERRLAAVDASSWCTACGGKYAKIILVAEEQMSEVYELGALAPMMNGGYGSGPKSQQTTWITAPDGTMTRYSSSDPAALAPYMTTVCMVV